jgi:MSHA pilin protein MshD
MFIRRPPAAGGNAYGLSLIELLFFIVIVSIAVIGILGVMNLNTGHSADPLLRKQALAFAEALLEEVESVPFDNVNDYHSLTLTGGSPGNPTSASVPAGYAAVVGVNTDPDPAFGPDAALPVADVRRITVTVTYNGGRDNVVLEGYRTRYGL